MELEGPRPKSSAHLPAEVLRRITLSSDSRRLEPLQKAAESPERPKDGVTPRLSPSGIFGGAGRDPRSTSSHLLLDDVRAVLRPVVDRRPVEPLHSPSRAPQDPVPLVVPLQAGAFMVRGPVRLDRHADVWEGEVDEVPRDAELWDWGESLGAHRLVELGLDWRHPDVSVRGPHSFRSRARRGFILQSLIDGCPPRVPPHRRPVLGSQIPA